MSLNRRLLVLLLVLGSLANFGGGTSASFTATTTNDGATFATGSLVLSDKVGSATACLSAGPGNSTDTNSKACDAPFSLLLQKPGTVATVDLDIANVGSIAGKLALAASGACLSSSVGTYFGSGNLCDVVRIQIQEYTSSANRTAGTTTGGTCWYGGGTATACASAATHTFTTFVAAHPIGTPINLDPGISTTTASPSEIRYFRITVNLDLATVGNTYQGRQAVAGFTWTLAQT